MKATRFRELLIDVSVVVSAVDGDVDESELSVVRQSMTNAVVGNDALEERLGRLEEVASSVQGRIEEKRAGCLDELRQEKLTDGQKRRLIELCCSVIGADGVFDSDEGELLEKIISACGLSVENAEMLCPDQTNILRSLGSSEGFAPPRC